MDQRKAGAETSKPAQSEDGFPGRGGGEGGKGPSACRGSESRSLVEAGYGCRRSASHRGIVVSHERTVTATFVPFLLVLSWLAAAPAPQPAPSAVDLARNLQQKYEQVRDFSADFEHIYEGGVLRKKLTERGTLLVKKPGMMRWVYTSPEKKEFVSDGRTLYAYVPADKQVIVSTVPPADEASSPAMFLAGKGSIQRDFTPRIAAAAGLAASELALELVPRTRQNEYRLDRPGRRSRHASDPEADHRRLTRGDLNVCLHEAA